MKIKENILYIKFYGFFYRIIMIVSHKYHWHHAPPVFPNGDIQLWCKWCGFRETIQKCNRPDRDKPMTKQKEKSPLKRSGCKPIDETWFPLSEKEKQKILKLFVDEYTKKLLF
jgi:hypothetical protein